MNWTGLGMREPIPVCYTGMLEMVTRTTRQNGGPERHRGEKQTRTIVFGGYELGDGGYPSRSRSSPWGGRL
ncbi:hypothetical protein V8C40DRAFT_249778 [Trichoderma camerunense]